MMTTCTFQSLDYLEVYCLDHLALVCDLHDVLGAEGDHQHVLPGVVHHLADLVQEVRLGPDLAPVRGIFPHKALVASHESGHVDPIFTVSLYSCQPFGQGRLSQKIIPNL